MPAITSLLTPERRRRGVEYLDDPAVDPAVVRRSMADVERSNLLFGGSRAVLAELAPALREGGPSATLLDIGTGLGDIPARARELAARLGVGLTTLGLDGDETLATASRRRTDATLRADALTLPVRDRSVDFVTCSQVLHHFADEDARTLLREMHRVARRRAIVADIRRSWLAAAGIWAVSFPLRFHPISRHDGVVSVLRGFTASELRELVRSAVGVTPATRDRAGFRVTASWRPEAA